MRFFYSGDKHKDKETKKKQRMTEIKYSFDSDIKRKKHTIFFHKLRRNHKYYNIQNIRKMGPSFSIATRSMIDEKEKLKL